MAAQTTLTTMDKLVSGQPAIYAYFVAFYTLTAAIIGFFVAIVLLLTGQIDLILHIFVAFVVGGAIIGVALKVGDTLRNR